MSIAPAGAGGQKEAGVPADKKWAPHCGAHWESDRVSVLSHPVCQTVRTQQDRRIYPFGNISWREFPEEIIRFGQKFQILNREFRAATGAFFHNSILFHRNCLLSCVFLFSLFLPVPGFQSGRERLWQSKKRLPRAELFLCLDICQNAEKKRKKRNFFEICIFLQKQENVFVIFT